MRYATYCRQITRTRSELCRIPTPLPTAPDLPDKNVYARTAARVAPAKIGGGRPPLSAGRGVVGEGHAGAGAVDAAGRRAPTREFKPAARTARARGRAASGRSRRS